MSEVHAVRRTRLRERVPGPEAAAALVSRPANVRYLTGCAPPGAALLLGPGRGRAALHPAAAAGDPPRAGPPTACACWCCPTRDGDPVVAGADLAAKAGADSLAVEEHHLTVTRHRALARSRPGCGWPTWRARSSSCG